MMPTAAISPVLSSLAERASALNQRAGDADAQSRAKAATEFESIFVAMVLKEMRQTLDGEGLFGGDASDAYGSLFDMFMGQHLAEAGGLGTSHLVAPYLDAIKIQ